MTGLIRFKPGGGVRKLFETGDRLRLGAIPRRASRVEVVTQDGPRFGQFFVDFSPLGEDYQFCLTRTFDDYGEAVHAEQVWLEQHWVMEGLPSEAF